MEPPLLLTPRLALSEEEEEVEEVDLFRAWPLSPPLVDDEEDREGLLERGLRLLPPV
jgi:hypothetical protein